MTSRLLISLSLALLAAQKVCAQFAPADDYFNSGAQSYISNNIPVALERVESGLKIYPDDEKLKKLEQLLKQQQQQQQSQSQQQKSDSQKNQQQNQQPQKDNSKDQQKADEKKPDQPDQKKDEPQKQPGQKPADEKPQGEEQTGTPGKMTPEEAKHLLDAQKGNEQLLQLKPQEKPQNNQKPVKDW